MSIEQYINVEERDQWDEIIQSKLIDIEEDTNPEDWQAIANRLPAGRQVSFARRWYYAAAAVIALFLLISGGYYYLFNTGDKMQVITVVKKEASVNDPSTTMTKSTDYKSAPANDLINNPSTTMEHHIASSMRIDNNHADSPSNEPSSTNPTNNTSHQQEIPVPSSDIKPIHQIIAPLPQRQYIADAKPVPSRSRWSFGAGGGSYSVGSNGGGMVYGGSTTDMLNFTGMFSNSEQYMRMPTRRKNYFNELLTDPSTSSLTTSQNNTTSIAKVGLKHKQPISFGIGVSYALDDRWSLQSGLIYTYLSSKWSTVLDYQGESRQQLHFVGIPLGINYKIAEWNKLRFYATAGGTGEINVGGNIKTDYYFYEDESVRTDKEYIRMKELQWSVNARLGATYPLIKFINAYIEGGANYFFQNKSSIETIRSDKPFHVSLQAGLRVGF